MTRVLSWRRDTRSGRWRNDLVAEQRMSTKAGAISECRNARWRVSL